MIQIGNFKAHKELHSRNPVGCEAITFRLTCERFIWAEVLTHRVSRNASSSRAIPWKRMKAWILQDPAMPLHLGANRPGMQSGGEVANPEAAKLRLLKMLMSNIAECDAIMEDHDLHKEIINRYIEAWGWINGVFTFSRPAFMNMCALRLTPFAHPNIQRLVVNMAREYVASEPDNLAPGDWHIPFISDFYTIKNNGPINIDNITWGDTKKLLVWSGARSAWTSYETVEEKVATWDQAVKRHNDCVNLKHATPLEHQKRANGDTGRNGGTTPGFDEYRHMIAGESVDYVDLRALLEGPYKDRDFIVAA